MDLEERFYKKFSRAQMEEGYLEKRLGKSPYRNFRFCWPIPPFLDAYAAWGADLVLSGQGFHGGTMDSGLGGLMTPPQFQFLRVAAGPFERTSRHQHDRQPGLGTHSINILS